MSSPHQYLRAEGISVSYGRTSALNDVSFDLHQGGLLLVLGPNGAGKTTLLRALAGSVAPRTGHIWLEQRDVTFLPAHRRVRAGIALVPEGRGVLPGLTVRENLDLGWHAGGNHQRAEKDQEWDRVIHLFPILGQRLDQDSSSLSGGEMQMLAIARALLARPKVLLLDEPSLGLAPQIVARVYDSLTQLNQQGLTMVLVEQKVIPLQDTADQVIVMQNGRAVYQGAGGQLSAAQLAELYLGSVAARQAE